MNETDLRELCMVLLFNRFFNGSDEERAIKQSIGVYKKIRKAVYDDSISK